VRDRLLPHALTPEEVQGLRQQLEQIPALKAAYVVRKEVRLVAEKPYYVVAVELHLGGDWAHSAQARLRIGRALRASAVPGAGARGFFLRLPFPGPQLIILGLVVLTLVAGLVPSRLSAWIEAIPLRVLVGVNATRFVGIAFLALAAQGQMNQAFADRAGWGDIATATLAIALVVMWAPITPARRVWYHAWNAFGF